jgi:hypothetical protein
MIYPPPPNPECFDCARRLFGKDIHPMRRGWHTALFPACLRMFAYPCQENWRADRCRLKNRIAGMLGRWMKWRWRQLPYGFPSAVGRFKATLQRTGTYLVRHRHSRILSRTSSWNGLYHRTAVHLSSSVRLQQRIEMPRGNGLLLNWYKRNTAASMSLICANYGAHVTSLA